MPVKTRPPPIANNATTGSTNKIQTPDIIEANPPIVIPTPAINTSGIMLYCSHYFTNSGPVVNI